MRLKSLRHNKLFVVFRNLIILESVAYLLFLMLALSADWGEWYEGLPASGYLRFEIIEFSLLGIAQFLIIFFVFFRSIRDERDIEDIMKTGEHERLEFKASLRWDSKRNQVNKDLERAVMKTVAAFLNSGGGNLLIGIGDGGNREGLEKDFASLPKQNSDGFENHFNNVFNMMIGPEFRQFVSLTFDNNYGKTVCLVSVEASHKPVYLKSGDSEDFYIRTGNATTPLKMSEVATYISSWKQSR